MEDTQGKSTRKSELVEMKYFEDSIGVRTTLDECFTDSVRRFPDRPALALGRRSWTYSELDAEARTVEKTLRTATFFGSRRHVGLIYARGAFSYASIVAIMRSDSVYVPLNGKLPTERLLKMIDDANIELVIIDTSEVLSDGVTGLLRTARPLQILMNYGVGYAAVEKDSNVFAQHTLWMSPETAQRTEESLEDPVPRSMNSGNLAYIIYTSGSTGNPKGVAIRHESVCRSIARMQKLFGTHEHDRFTQFSPLAFDGSIFDLFLCWTSGAASFVPAPEEALVPLDFTVKNEITVWGSVPSLANFLLKLRLLRGGTLQRVRLSFFFGEALPVELVKAWMVAAPASRIFNLYGPTECSICATYYECDKSSTCSQGMVPIGLTLPGVRHEIVEDGHRVSGDGQPGELWLSGDQLAVGYWNNPAATAAAFVRAPFEDPEAVWYRTGDLVSARPGAGLSFRGRLDRQVKLRGFRIELQEVEEILRDEIGCGAVAVVAVRNGNGICEMLVAYCEELPWDEAATKVRCLRRMPRYMIPERIVELRGFPLNENGKVDYQSLLALTEALRV